MKNSVVGNKVAGIIVGGIFARKVYSLSVKARLNRTALSCRSVYDNGRAAGIGLRSRWGKAVNDNISVSYSVGFGFALVCKAKAVFSDIKLGLVGENAVLPARDFRAVNRKRLGGVAGSGKCKNRVVNRLGGLFG